MRTKRPSRSAWPGKVQLLLPMVALALIWAWWTGRLKQFSLDDAIGATVFILGARMLTTGRILPGALLMAGGLLYIGFRRGRFRHDTAMPLDDARRLLGVAEGASVSDIRAAHRRLIAKVHPDAGGSEDLAQRINAARDALIAAHTRGNGSRGDSIS
jgi:DnaJ family protein C protein 19